MTLPTRAWPGNMLSETAGVMGMNQTKNIFQIAIFGMMLLFSLGCAQTKETTKSTSVEQPEVNTKTEMSLHAASRF